MSASTPVSSTIRPDLSDHRAQRDEPLEQLAVEPGLGRRQARVASDPESDHLLGAAGGVLRLGEGHRLGQHGAAFVIPRRVPTDV